METRGAEGTQDASTWQQQQIGTVPAPGVMVEAGGILTAVSAGEIAGATDQFLYDYQPLSGDGEIVARIVGLHAVDAWSEAGLMIREALTPTATGMFVGATGGNGWVAQRRDDSTSGLIETTYGPPGIPPGWVRLVREGDRVSAFESGDGLTWTLLSARTIPMRSTVFVGLAVASHSQALATAWFSDVTVRSTNLDNVPPMPTPRATVSLVSPVDGSTVFANQPVSISATVTNLNAAVGRVDFYADDALIGSAGTPPYAFTWTGGAEGSHLLTAVATFSSGEKATSRAVGIVVSPASPSPFPSDPSPPPAGWQQQQIGGAPGVMFDAGGFLTAVSAGEIGGATDRFLWVYQPLSGDGEIVARIVGLRAVDEWSEAGVMIREALTPTSTEMFVGGTGGNGWVAQRRDDSTAGQTETTSGPPGEAPGWVRLTREGDRISAFVSGDGVEWTLVSARTIPMRSTVFVGLAVASHSQAVATAWFSGVSVRPTTASHATPTLSLISPADGATVVSYQPLMIAATTNDPNRTVGSVTFLVNGVQVGTDATEPYSVVKTLAPGTYRIAAVAASTAGSISSQTVSVTVTAPVSSSQSVTIAITSPLAGATFTAPATIAIAAAPSVDGTISQLNVYGDGTLIGSRTTSPYSFTWNNVGAGIHLLSAVATLGSGVSISSETVPVSVGAGKAQAATLVFTPSVDEAVTVDDYTVEIYLIGGATPVASRDLGKPPATNGETSVDVDDLIDALPHGTYTAVVTAVGPGGSTASQPSPAFTK